MNTVLVDAGPLVAYLDDADQHHAWAKSQFIKLCAPVLTCESVLSETCHLLERVHGGAAKVAEMLNRGVIGIAFDLGANHTRVFELMRRYGDVPMSLADACLVCMAEDTSGSQVFSTDTDFRIYRLSGRKPLPVMLPKGK